MNYRKLQFAFSATVVCGKTEMTVGTMVASILIVKTPARPTATQFHFQNVQIERNI